MASSIGIKIANGEFYPILSDDAQSKKRMTLTTVHDGQRSVQIDLYRSETKSMTDAQPIGSLVVEKIKPKKKGEPSVELVVSLDENGEISAEAKDLDNPKGEETPQLSVSLKTLTQHSSDERISDFELEGEEENLLPTTSSSGASGAAEDDDIPADTDFTEDAGALPARSAKKKAPVLLIVAAIVLVVGVCLGLWLFVFGGEALLLGRAAAPESKTAVEIPVAPPVSQEHAKPPAAQAAPPVQQPPAQTQVREPPAPPKPAAKAPAPVVKPAAPAKQAAKPAAVSRARRNPPVRTYKVPSVIPKGGVSYKIRWGDTLWDISQAFYRTPWRFKFLARYNGIKNPDRIISGRTIRIPPR